MLYKVEHAPVSHWRYMYNYITLLLLTVNVCCNVSSSLAFILFPYRQPQYAHVFHEGINSKALSFHGYSDRDQCLKSGGISNN